MQDTEPINPEDEVSNNLFIKIIEKRITNNLDFY